MSPMGLNRVSAGLFPFLSEGGVGAGWVIPGGKVLSAVRP